MAQCGRNVEGIDITQYHLNKASKLIAKNNLGDRIKVRAGSYDDLAPHFEPGNLDGVYSMETLVHSEDPQKCFNEFFRVLRPGGRVAFHEYNCMGMGNLAQHVDSSRQRRRRYNFLDRKKKMSPSEKEAHIQWMLMRWREFDEEASLPALVTWGPGVMEKMLTNAGFVDVKIEDISDHVKPCTKLFFQMAYIPYLFISLTGTHHRFTNTCAGVYGWWGWGMWKYVSATARKPDAPDVVASA